MTRNSLFSLAGLASALGNTADILLPSQSPITQSSSSVMSEKEKHRIDNINASRSQRQMCIDRGHNPISVGARRIDRNRNRMLKSAIYR